MNILSQQATFDRFTDDIISLLKSQLVKQIILENVKSTKHSWDQTNYLKNMIQVLIFTGKKSSNPTRFDVLIDKLSRMADDNNDHISPSISADDDTQYYPGPIVHSFGSRALLYIPTSPTSPRSSILPNASFIMIHHIAQRVRCIAQAVIPSD